MSHLIMFKNSSHYGGVFDMTLVLEEEEGPAKWDRTVKRGTRHRDKGERVRSDHIMVVTQRILARN
jgi:hypothetical protein